MRDMIFAVDPDAGPGWQYHFVDGDFTALGAGSFTAVLVTMTDGEQETFPTKGQLTVTIIPLP